MAAVKRVSLRCEASPRRRCPSFTTRRGCTKAAESTVWLLRLSGGMEPRLVAVRSRLPLAVGGVTFTLAALACGHSAATPASHEAPQHSVSAADSPASEAVGVTHRPSTRQDIAEPAIHANDVRSVALAHCEQQQRCGFVGAGLRYATTEDCLARVQQTQASVLNDFSCEAGSDAQQLRSCLELVRTMDCAQPFAEVRGLDPCGAPRLCLSGVAQGDPSPGSIDAVER